MKKLTIAVSIMPFVRSGLPCTGLAHLSTQRVNRLIVKQMCHEECGNDAIGVGLHHDSPV